MINESSMFIKNPSLLADFRNNLFVSGNIHAQWIFSYDFYLLLGIVGVLILWNIWLTYKLHKLGGRA